MNYGEDKIILPISNARAAPQKRRGFLPLCQFGGTPVTG
jgi:hypothetical protein